MRPTIENWNIYQSEQQVAIAAVTAAACLCESVRSQKLSFVLKKADMSPVTIADFASQSIICRSLAQAFPNDPIIAEEDAAFLQQPAASAVLEQVCQLIPQATPANVLDWVGQGNGQIASRYWTLDPIDGTKGFLRGDQYAIALALVEQGEVKLGVMACPALSLNQQTPPGVLFVAVRGQGTNMMSLQGTQARPIQVNHSDDIRRLCRIESVESAHSDRAVQLALDRILGWTQPPKSMDSQAKYGMVAKGEADLYLRIPLPHLSACRENIWDHATGAILVEEAGGKVSDLAGKPLDFSVSSQLINNSGIVASNGLVHEAVLAAIAQVKA